MTQSRELPKLPRVDLTQIDWLSKLNSIQNFPIECLPKSERSSKHHTCPICQTPKAFRFTNYRGTGDWICKNCGAGNGVKLIQLTLNLNFHEIFSLLRGNYVEVPVQAPRPKLVDSDQLTPKEIARNLAKLKQIYGNSQPISKRDFAWKYLSKRVPYLALEKLDQCHRFHPALEFGEEDDAGNYIVRGKFPALLAVVKDGSLTVTMHRHYVTPKGTKVPFENAKQQLPGVRKLLGAYIPVVTNPLSRVLAVGEGFETMAAAAVAHHYDINVRSFLNEGNLRKASVSKDDYDKVIIYADHDRYNEKRKCRVGEDAARCLALRLQEQGIEVEIRIPATEEEDWCDVWFKAAQRIPNLTTSLISRMYQEKSDDPFGIIAHMLEEKASIK